MKNICGPVFERLNDTWCDGTRIREELAECRTGFFLQFHLVWQVSNQIGDDLRVALDTSLHSLRLPHRRFYKSLSPRGSTCYSGTKFITIVNSKHWETHLIAAGRRACPTNYGNVVHYRPVRRSMDETGALHDRRLRSFVGTDTCQKEQHLLHRGRGLHTVVLPRWRLQRHFEACPLADYAAFKDQDPSRGFLANGPERILLDTPYWADDTASRGDAPAQESVPQANQSWLDEFQ